MVLDIVLYRFLDIDSGARRCIHHLRTYRGALIASASRLKASDRRTVGLGGQLADCTYTTVKGCYQQALRGVGLKLPVRGHCGLEDHSVGV